MRRCPILFISQHTPRFIFIYFPFILVQKKNSGGRVRPKFIELNPALPPPYPGENHQNADLTPTKKLPLTNQ